MENESSDLGFRTPARGDCHKIGSGSISYKFEIARMNVKPIVEWISTTQNEYQLDLTRGYRCLFHSSLGINWISLVISSMQLAESVTATCCMTVVQAVVQSEYFADETVTFLQDS